MSVEVANSSAVPSRFQLMRMTRSTVPTVIDVDVTGDYSGGLLGVSLDYRFFSVMYLSSCEASYLLECLSSPMWIVFSLYRVTINPPSSWTFGIDIAERMLVQSHLRLWHLVGGIRFWSLTETIYYLSMSTQLYKLWVVGSLVESIGQIV